MLGLLITIAIIIAILFAICKYADEDVAVGILTAVMTLAVMIVGIILVYLPYVIVVFVSVLLLKGCGVI